jgi:hypothetical protein
VSRDVLVPGGIGGNPLGPLGDPLPIHEAVSMFQPTDVPVIARGLGLDQRLVASVLGTDLVAEPVEPGVLDHDINTFDQMRELVVTLDSLHGDLDEFVGELDLQADVIAKDVQEGRGGPIIDGLNGGRR